MSGCFLGKGLGRSSLCCDCCEIVPQLPGTQAESGDHPHQPHSFRGRMGVGKQTPFKACGWVLGLPSFAFSAFSTTFFCGETPLAFLILDAIVAVDILCLFLYKLQHRVLLCCLPGEAVVLWPSVTKGNSITAVCLCLGMKLAFIPKAFQGFFCGLLSSGQSWLPSPLASCAFLLLPPHRSHPLGSGQEAACGAHLLPSPPFLLAVSSLGRGAGSGDELVKSFLMRAGGRHLTVQGLLGWEFSRSGLVLFF